MTSFLAFLAFIVHILDIPNHNGEEAAPSSTGALPVLPSPSAGSSPPLDSLPQPSLPQPTGPTASSQPNHPRRQRSSPFLSVAPRRRRTDIENQTNTLSGTDIENHVPDSHEMDKLSWTALVYCFTAGLEFNAILAQAKDPSNVTIRVHFLSVLLSIALLLLIAANAIFARTYPKMAREMDRVGKLIVLISSIIAAMPTVPEYVSVGCTLVMIILYAHQCFVSS